MEQMELFNTNDADIREHWGNLASNFLVGKTIRRVRYLNDQEREDIAWNKSALIIEFTDGHWLIPMRDDEGNDAGSLWTSSQSKLNVIPTI
jgi:hypothetical protein